MNAPTQALQVLIVEDSEADALMLETKLEDAGYQPQVQRVATRAELNAALRRQPWEVIICDDYVPGFNPQPASALEAQHTSLDALGLVKSLGLDLPFIIVSGHITEEIAVTAMKAGAHDYIMKDNLARLGPAVQRELREAQVRRERRRADEKLKVEQVFRQAIENSVPSGIAAVDLEGRQTYVNPAFCRMLGWPEQELVGARPPFAYWPPDQVEQITSALARVIQGQAPAGGIELPFRRRSGERIEVLVQITPLKDSFGNLTGWVSSASDITERKRAEARLAAEHAITRMLVNASSLDATAPALLQELLGALEMDWATLWLAEPDPRLLRPALSRLRTASATREALVATAAALRLGPGVGLPGQVWQQRSAHWVADLTLENQGESSRLAAQAGLRGALAFPIQSAEAFFGVVELLCERPLEEDRALLNMVSAIGSEIGQFVQRRQAEVALRKAHDELEVRVLQRTAELKAANAKLQASILERKRLENELLEITEKERRRIGLDLHDDLGQKLSGIALMTKGLELKLTKEKADAAQDAARIHTLVQEAMNHASDLAHDLATLDLAEQDLPSALTELAAHASDMFQITCRFSAEGPVPPLEPNMVTQLYKIAQEAVTNAIKHGKAKRVNIQLANGSDGLVLTVQNNGIPFPDLRTESTGMGLRIMSYRASLLGGTLSIKGNGTRGSLLTCSVPLEKPPKA